MKGNLHGKNGDQLSFEEQRRLAQFLKEKCQIFKCMV
jgi:hypothetical protein